MKDHLTKAIADGVRIYAAVTTQLAEEARRRHDCFPVAAAALGRTMTGALLLAANLKNDEALTVKFKGDGPLAGVTADATPEGFVRGYVGEPHVDLPLNAAGKIDVGAGVGKGTMSVTRFTKLKEPVTGSAEIFDGEIANDITHYLFASEQTPSSVGLGVLVDADLSVIASGGFFLQPLPDATDEVLRRLEDNLGNFSSVSQTVKDGADAHGIIEKLLRGFDVKYLSTTELFFKCRCSRRRIEDMLMGLAADDLRSLVADGRAEVCCHFCGEKYEFDKAELEAVLGVKKRIENNTKN